MPVDYSRFIRKYLGHHYGRIKPPRLQINADGTVDFDFGDEQLYHTGSTSYSDIVSFYLYYKIGRDWVATQLQAPLSEMHPIAHWFGLQSAQIEKRKQGKSTSLAGAEICWRYLGYHLSLIAEHAALSSKLIKDLRNPDKFQGTRFEVVVAAAMIVAGFDLEYTGEKGPGKHPEFIATDIETGTKFAVEAKSCHRHGILGFVNETGEDQPVGIAAARQLRKAVEKNTVLPLLSFIELNSPGVKPNDGDPIHAELDSALNLDMTKWKELGFPCVGVFFYNDAAAHHLDQNIDLKKQYGWLRHASFENRHNMDAKPFLARIAEGFAKAVRIPDISWDYTKIAAS